MLLPLMRRRISAYGDRMWNVVVGITLRSEPPAVLIKPPRVLAEADIRIGEKLFRKFDEVNDRVRATTCHELVHAYASRRRLPIWLNEGIAMLTVDRLFGFTTLKPETLELFGAESQPIRSYRALPRLADAQVVSLYARGYWLARYLHEQHHEELQRVLAKRMAIGVSDPTAAAIFRAEGKNPWAGIDKTVQEYFRRTTI